MSISERERRIIYDNLEATVGIEAANYLMKMIPYPDPSELATRTDVHAETAVLRGEMAELRGELRTEMSELRTELKQDMSELRTELRQDMSELRTEIRSDMAELRSEVAGFKAEVAVEFGELRTEVANLRTETKADLLAVESRLDSRFEGRFSEMRALTVRMFAASLTANAVAVVTALAA